jgi:periplasmic protein TonB
MNDEQFDKELAELYQQRKGQIVVPEVNLAESRKNRNYSFIKLISIFTVGGIASFGIMAVITHFAKSPKYTNTVFSSSHQVNLVEKKMKANDDQLINNAVSLPHKPELPPLLPELNVLIPVKNILQESDIDTININAGNVVQIPHLQTPEFLFKPVFKVMPKFPKKSLKDKESGAIRLRYEIDTSGKVQNIKVIESRVTRELQHSAINALEKWRYEPDVIQSRKHEIIFEFNQKTN